MHSVEEHEHVVVFDPPPVLSDRLRAVSGPEFDRPLMLGSPVFPVTEAAVVIMTLHRHVNTHDDPGEFADLHEMTIVWGNALFETSDHLTVDVGLYPTNVMVLARSIKSHAAGDLNHDGDHDNDI